MRDGVRILAKGELTVELNMEVTGASKAAIAMIEKFGGSVKLKSSSSVADDAITQ